jgi:hypothetical protein
MTRSKIPRWLQSTLIGTLIVGGTLLLVMSQVEVPHPFFYGPKESAQLIHEAPQTRRWVVTRAYGSLSAQSLELSEIRVRGDALPHRLQASYYDGVAHHLPFELDALDESVADIHEYIPASQQRFFFDGIMRAFTVENGRTPVKIMDFAQTLTDKTGTPDLSNGIRIGIQQAFGDDVSEAIEIAKRYPEDIYYPLFEELGWRVGTDKGIDVDTWHEYEESLPAAAACWFAEGMVRGRTILALGETRTWWPEVQQFRSEVASQCGPEIASGVAEALLIVLCDGPEALALQLKEIGAQRDIDMVRSMLEIKQSRGVGKNLAPLPGAEPNLSPL